MEKTIQGLNQKAWYRLIKVLFLLVGFLVFAGYNAAVFFGIGFKNIDQNKTAIQCTYPDKSGTKRIITPKSVKTTIKSYDLDNGQFDYKHYFESYNDYSIKAIFSGCYDYDADYIDPFAVQRRYELGLDKATPAESLASSGMKDYYDAVKINPYNKSKYVNYNVHLFEVQVSYSYSAFFTWFIVGNLIIFTVFELIRRMFYYIVLGNLRPRKN